MCLPLASQFIKWINRFRYPKRYGIRFVGEDGNHRGAGSPAHLTPLYESGWEQMIHTVPPNATEGLLRGAVPSVGVIKR